MRWIAESTDEGWQPTLEGDGCMFSLPLWFNSEEACSEFIEAIPAGAQQDGQRVPDGWLECVVCAAVGPPTSPPCEHYDPLDFDGSPEPQVGGDPVGA